jgi:hypothetical protein
MLSRIIVFSLALVAGVGCSTPASVKVTLQAQTAAYEKLDANISDLQSQYVALHERLSERRRQANRYGQLQHVLKAMRGEKVRETYATEHFKDLKVLGERLLKGNYQSDAQGAAIDRYREDLQLALKHFRGAVKAADDATKEQNKVVSMGVRATSQEFGRIQADIGSLRVVNKTIAEFLSIDLSPGEEASRELAASLEALRKEP